MKKLILFIVGIIVVSGILAQAPQGITNQGVVRDSNNQILVNAPVGKRVSILQGSVEGSAVYVETHSLTTNANGLITYIIGEGDEVEGTFADIDWSDGPYFLKTEADPEGGTDYSISGVTQFLSVPYAMYAKESAGVNELFDLLDEVMDELDLLKDLAGVGAVEDIDGNTYRTIEIGDQTWMKENLRVTSYNDGTDISADMSNQDWGNTDETSLGAYAIYPHDDVDGLDSDAEVVAAYGKLYNWYAVDDDRGLCPDGWRVPSDEDWDQLVDYVTDQGYPNEQDNLNGAGNALKSCRQVDLPLGGDCDTSEHPRWDEYPFPSHDEPHYGLDAFGFSAFPGGIRDASGNFKDVGSNGYWWSDTALDSGGNLAWGRGMDIEVGNVIRPDSNPTGYHMSNGFSVRCLRDNVRTEDE